ncbi:MAG TPA: transposase [Methylosinus sp.]
MRSARASRTSFAVSTKSRRWPCASTTAPALRPRLRKFSSTPCGRSDMGKAVAYLLNHWNGLTLFLDDGRIEMDTNLVENQIRPLTLTRENALFAGHDEGGRSWSRLASLIATCKLNNVDPYAWMKATLEAIADGHPQSRIDELMPWAFKSSSPSPAA